MMQPETFQPSSWQLTLDQVGFYGLNDMDSQVDTFEYFSPPFTNSTTEDISDSSSIPYFSSNYSMEFTGSPPCEDGQSQATFPVEDFWEDLDRFEPATYDEIMDLINGDGDDSLDESEGKYEHSSSVQDLSMSTTTNQGEGTWSPTPSIRTEACILGNTKQIQLSSVVPPGGDMEGENGQSTGLFHLLKAYGEEVEGGQGELADVIMKRVAEKVSPAGESMERVAFYLCQDGEKQADKDYIRQESCKKPEEAHRVCYQVFPYGRLAHFSANSTILEAIPAEAEVIHIVDFDLLEGIQWPPVIEALAYKRIEVKLTALKMENDQEESVFPWSFEDTKRRLVEHARSVGLKLKVEEMGTDELVSEIKRGRKRGGRREYLAFNCMIGLPHMARLRSRKLVEEFLRVAKESLAYPANSSRGIIVLGDGDALEFSKLASGFGSFFEGNLAHYQALLDSIQSSFPSHLSEARMALETLFVAPSISSPGWVQKWVEIREGCNLQMGVGMEGHKVSTFVLGEAREMVRNLHSSYAVRIGGDRENVMILEWKDVPLVKVSAWVS